MPVIVQVINIINIKKFQLINAKKLVEFKTINKYPEIIFYNNRASYQNYKYKKKTNKGKEVSKV